MLFKKALKIYYPNVLDMGNQYVGRGKARGINYSFHTE